MRSLVTLRYGCSEDFVDHVRSCIFYRVSPPPATAETSPPPKPQTITPPARAQVLPSMSCLCSVFDGALSLSPARTLSWSNQRPLPLDSSRKCWESGSKGSRFRRDALHPTDPTACLIFVFRLWVRKADGKLSKVKDAKNFEQMGKIACEDSKPLGATVSPAAVSWASGIACAGGEGTTVVYKRSLFELTSRLGVTR